jgi:hypothetical protein
VSDHDRTGKPTLTIEPRLPTFDIETQVRNALLAGATVRCGTLMAYMIGSGEVCMDRVTPTKRSMICACSGAGQGAYAFTRWMRGEL